MWTIVEGTFDLLTSAQLPENGGSIVGLQTLPNRIDELYVLSGYDQVFKAKFGNNSSLGLMLPGMTGLLCLAPHPTEESFFTSSGDNRIQKWHPDHGTVWDIVLQSPASSLSVHPSGEVLAVANVGDIFVLTALEGVQVSVLPVSTAPLTSLSYSQNGLLLAASSLDGNLYFMHVAENGLSYQSLSLLKVRTSPRQCQTQFFHSHDRQSGGPILSLQWSADSQYILTNVENEGLNELVLCE